MEDLRDRLAAIQPAFPKDAKAPTISRFNNETHTIWRRSGQPRYFQVRLRIPNGRGYVTECRCILSRNNLTNATSHHGMARLLSFLASPVRKRQLA
jgi:hypothetical protein